MIENRENKADDGGRHTNFIFFIFSIIFIFSILSALLAYAIFVPQGLQAGNVSIEISSGMGSREIARELKSRGLIRSAGAFATYAALSGSSHRLKPGRYEFGPVVTVPGIVRELVRGEAELALTIPEGWDLRQIGRYLERLGLFPAEEWWRVAGAPGRDYRQAGNLPPFPDFSNQFRFLGDKPPGVGLEGFLYPDTYRIFRDSSAEDIVEKMLSNFDQKLSPDLRAEIRRQGKTPFEVVTMASLLESEAANTADRKLISGILWKRLSAGIPLQVDSSVNYITGKRETPSAGDLAIGSPYNTYRFPGLPLGPISNPSLDSIRASLEPEPSPFLYYLSAPDGRTIYSRTLQEHRRAKAQHLGR